MNYRNWDNHALRHECVKLSGELEQAKARIEALEGAMTDHILDWVVCGMSANNRFKDEWAVKEYENLKRALSNTKGQG